ncbi:DUF3781 domain-containing protein [Ligilactobacillus sp. WILCCON 0076]|uniref:DUF3781 domain-containing protein n=1 Tax=Ligilactobacillus ubinensis TaxID=2876789 RepID=A0A9X2FST7_9LACO|nr:DUF3781 domain-containing protein [Ligilactobacillus ubinensis]MCP0887973.1 DUF3781 domain-containing protein [Ligilactobacillus ubinensis]
MQDLIQNILKHLCYTELVYLRINKKLQRNLSVSEIENLIRKAILATTKIEHIGKNYYLYDYTDSIRITINANTFRIITVDSLKHC